MEESQSQRDRRVEELWKQLDPAGHGELDLKGLQRGLRRIDHRKYFPFSPFPLFRFSGCCTHDFLSALKNADQMLKTILSIVDTSGDGKIQYEGVFGETGNAKCGAGGLRRCVRRVPSLRRSRRAPVAPAVPIDRSRQRRTIKQRRTSERLPACWPVGAEQKAVRFLQRDRHEPRRVHHV